MATSKALTAEHPVPVPARKKAPARLKAEPPEQRWWRRPVRPLTFFFTTLLLSLAVGGAGFFLYQEAQREAPERIPLRKVVEFQRKKKTLNYAKRLRQQGRYTESAVIYDQYLKRYPWSTVAKQGRAASLALAEKSAPRSEARRSSEARRPVVAAEQRKADPERRSVRQRVRRLFRRGS